MPAVSNDLDSAKNMKITTVLSNGSNALCFVVIIDGKKVFTWDQNYFPLPAHDNVDQFVVEIMRAASEISKQPESVIAKIGRVNTRDALTLALNAWPSDEVEYATMSFKAHRSDGFELASLRFFCATPLQGSHSPLERHPLFFASPGQNSSSKE